MALTRATMLSMELFSVLTCPECARSERLAMPTDGCVFFHECSHCHVVLRPNRGDCCVFCSFGSVRCPSMQVETSNQHQVTHFIRKGRSD